MIELLVRAMPTRIIAVHGAIANAATWLPLQREFGEMIDFIAPDLPGHGTKRDVPFQLESSIELITSLVTEDRPRDLQPTILVGDSLGGYLSILAGARLGDRVDAIVVSGASFSMKGFAANVAALSDLPVQVARMLIGRDTLENLFAKALRKMTDPTTAEAVVARGLNLSTRTQSLNALYGIDLRTALKALRCPIYFVNGSLDVPAVWNTKSFAGYAKEGYAVIIPGAWHTCMLTNPKEVAEVIHTALIRINRKRAIRTSAPSR